MDFFNKINQTNINRITKKIEFILNFLLFFLLLLMVSIVFANVVSRYVFSSSLNWVDELSRAAFVWLAFIGIVAVMWERGHIGLGNILENVNPTLGKIALFIGIILQVIFIYYLFNGGLRLVSLTLIQLTPYMAIPCGYIYIIAPIMAIFMMLISIRDLILILKKDQEEKR